MQEEAFRKDEFLADILLDNLQIAYETFVEKEYDVLMTRTILLQSKVNLIKCDYIECRKKAIVALNCSKEIQHHSTMMESNKIIKLVSLKIQIEYNNLIIFVKSDPLNSCADFGKGVQIITKHFVDEKSLIINKLWDHGLQLNL